MLEDKFRKDIFLRAMCIPTLARFADWVHQSMRRAPVSHFSQLSNEETWKVHLFLFKSITSFQFLQKLVRRLPNFFMEEGHWFVSVYNDDGDEHNVVLVPQNSQVSLTLFIQSLCRLENWSANRFTHPIASVNHWLAHSLFTDSLTHPPTLQQDNFCRSWQRAVWTGATDTGLVSLESVSAILALMETTAVRVRDHFPFLLPLHFILPLLLLSF